MDNGYYKIILVDNPTLCADITGASTVLNAGLELYSSTDSSTAQLFKIQNGITTSTNKSLMAQCSNMFWYVNKTTTLEKQQVKQYSSSGISANEEDWEFEDTGMVYRLNGETIPIYKIKSKADTSKDYYVGSDSAASGSLLYISNSGIVRQFIAVKEIFFNQGITTPSVSLSSKESIAKNTEEIRKLTLSGCKYYQVRSRYKCLNHDTNTWTDWSLYSSPAGLTTDNGWGNVWNYNATDSINAYMQATNDLTGAITPLSSTPYDSVMYEVEVRGYEETTHKYHGYSNTKSIITKQKLEASDIAVTMGTTGLNVAWKTNAYRTIDKIAVTISDIKQDDDKVADGKQVTFETCASGRISIPYEELYFYPIAGSKVSFSISFTPLSDYLSSISIGEKQYEVTYDGGDLQPKIEVYDTSMYDILASVSEKTAQQFDYLEMSLIYEHDGKVIRHKLKRDGTSYAFKCAPPLGIDYALFVYIENTDNNKWGVASITITDTSTPYAWKPKPHVVINTINTEIAFTSFDTQSPTSKSKELTTESLSLEGKQYEDVFYGTVQPSKIEIHNAWFKDSERYKIEKALNDGYCLLRDGSGLFCYAAIKSINYTRINEGFSKCTISLVETAYEIDYKIPY